MGDLNNKWMPNIDGSFAQGVDSFVKNPTSTLGKGLGNIMSSVVKASLGGNPGDKVSDIINNATGIAAIANMPNNSPPSLEQQALQNQTQEQIDKANITSAALNAMQIRQQREKAGLASNKNGTILTSPLGLTNSPIMPRKTLLGE